MKKYNCLILMLITFFIGLNVTNAKSITYVYKNSANNQIVKVTVEDTGKISYSPSGFKGVKYEISGMSASNFLTNGRLKSCSEINKVAYLSVNTSDSTEDKIVYYFSFSNSAGVGPVKFNLDSSLCEENGTESDNKIALPCPYNNGLTINYFEDGTVGGIYKDNYLVTITGELRNKPETCWTEICYYEEGSTITAAKDCYGALNKHAQYGTAGTNSNKNPNVDYVTDIIGDSGNVTMGDAEGIDFCSKDGVKQVLHIVGFIIFFAKIVVPLILIIMGSIDIISTLKDPDEKGVKDQLFKFGKRVIAAVIIFFIPTIINLVFSLIENATDYGTAFNECTDCVFKPLGGTCSYHRMGEED